MNRILFAPDELNTPLPLHDIRAVHLISILGVHVGSQVSIGVIDGEIGTATVTAITAVGIELDVALSGSTGEGLLPVTVLLGHPRPLVLKRVLRDLCTIGVGRVVVCATALGEKSYFSSSLWSGQTVRNLLVEGAAIAGSTRLTEVLRARSVSHGLHLVSSPSEKLELVFDEATVGQVAYLPTFAPPAPAAVTVAIGSERGWTDRERELFAAGHWQRAGLGPRVLRTETAVTTVATMIALWYHRQTDTIKISN